MFYSIESYWKIQLRGWFHKKLMLRSYDLRKLSKVPPVWMLKAYFEMSLWHFNTWIAVIIKSEHLVSRRGFIEDCHFSDSPVLWIRIDPDMQLIRSVEILQPDFQWQYQLRHERDITAQAEAVVALEKFPTMQTKKALTDIIENESCFYKVRSEIIFVRFWTTLNTLYNFINNIFLDGYARPLASR